MSVDGGFALGISLIKRFEGCVLTAYPDPGTAHLTEEEAAALNPPRKPGDPWTVGWGTTGRLSDGRPIAAGLTITQEEADTELVHRARGVTSVLADLVKVPLSDSEFGACLSLAWNIGTHAFGASTVLHRLNLGDYDGAARAFLLWDKAAGSVNADLVKRRNEEMQVFLQDKRRTTGAA